MGCGIDGSPVTRIVPSLQVATSRALRSSGLHHCRQASTDDPPSVCRVLVSMIVEWVWRMLRPAGSGGAFETCAIAHAAATERHAYGCVTAYRTCSTPWLWPQVRCSYRTAMEAKQKQSKPSKVARDTHGRHWADCRTALPSIYCACVNSKFCTLARHRHHHLHRHHHHYLLCTARIQLCYGAGNPTDYLRR